MKKILLILTIGSFGCMDDRETPPANPDPVTVAVESKEDYGGLYKRSSKEDLLENIYKEQVKNSPALKRLEGEIDTAFAYRDSLKKFNEYDGVNREYFYSANAHKESITDSTLKKRIAALISNYSERYSLLVGEHRKLLSELDTNKITMEDLHVALKIVQTLPDIHEYQKKNLPPAKPMQDAVQKQKNVINKLDAAVKKGG